MKPKTVSLKISNCQDCPHHKDIPSPPTGDSFDMVDLDTICTLLGGPKGGKHITGSNRPWEVRRNCAVPDWCPLTAKPKKVSRKQKG